MSTSIRILIVDNDHRTADMLSDPLKRYGYNVVSAYNGNDAICLFDKLNPQLVLIETRLSDMPGETICAYIRQKSNTPILILSSQNDEESILNGFNLGADDYVTKPFSISQVTARINTLLRRYQEGIKFKKII